MEVSPLRFYLIALRPKIVFSGRVAVDPTDPYMSIQWNNGATGSVGAPLPGNTVWFGSTEGEAERGTLRLRSWTPQDATGTAGTLSVAESDDVGPDIATNDYITIKQEFRLWPIYPRILEISDTEVVYYEDYDIEFNDQTVDWEPIAVAGPPGVAFLDGGIAQISFVGDRSFAMAPGAIVTGSAPLWRAYGSLEVTSSALGSEASPTTFTWTGTAAGQYDGQYLVSLQVTDDNGNDHTNYTWGIVIDPNDPGATVHTNFDTMSDSMDFDQGGGECSFVVHGGATVSQFPEGTMIILAAMGDITTATGSWPFRTNVLFVGHIIDGSVRQNPSKGDVRFRAGTVDAIMRNTTTWPVSLTDKIGPKNWTMAKNLTVDRACSFLWRYRSTLSTMTPIIPSNYSPFIKRQDFAPSDLYSNLDTFLSNAWGHVWANHQGVLYHNLDYQTMLDAEQATITTRKTLYKGIWVDDVEIDERADYAWPTNQVKQNGIYYPGSQGDVVPLFSEAPGDAMKVFGGEDGLEGFILNTQSDLNVRCGRTLAKQIQKYPVVRMRFLNDGAFTVGPQEVFPAIIEAADNDRGVAWEFSLLPRRIRRTYNHLGGYFISEVEFEPSTTGKAGVTVVMPPHPPDPELPPWDPGPEIPWTPPASPTAGPAVAADGAMGVYWSLDTGASWAARNNDAPSTQFRDLIWDPWWRERTGGHDPEQSILLGCGVGFVARSDDAGKNWIDLTLNMDDPPNDWEDSPAPTKEDLTYIQIHGDIHNIDVLYVLAEWQNDSDAWRGYLLRSADFGLTWDAAQPLGGEATDCAGGWCYAVNVFNRVACRRDATWPPGTYRMFQRYTDPANPDGNAEGQQDGNYSRTYRRKVNNSPICTGGDPTSDMGMVLFADFGGQVYGPAVTFEGYSRGTITKRPSPNLYGSNDTNPDWEAKAWTLVDTDFDWYEKNGAFAWRGDTVSAAITSPGYRYWKFENDHETGDADMVYADFDAMRTDGDIIPGGGDARPLWMDLDTYNGETLWVTIHSSGATLYLQKRLASDLSLVSRTSFGTATDGQVAAKLRWIAPRAPHLPGVGDFSGYVYVFGRYDDGAVKHLAYSDDGAASFSNAGDGAWAAERIGAFDVATIDGQSLLAILNAASPTLWQSPDAGATWGQINTVPFNVEADAMSRHWGENAELLIGNNTGTTQMAAYVASPYTAAWTDATGPGGSRLPTAADGGVGIWSIIWV